MGIGIKGIAYVLPDSCVTNDDLAREHPTWDMRQVEARTGVAQRYVAASKETSLDLGLRACEKLFTANPGLRNDVDSLLFCTESPDYIMPPNACILQGKLGLRKGTLAFDFNLACSGFVYGLAIARGLIVSGMCENVILVCGETYSKYTCPEDRSVTALFGDGAAAAWIRSVDGKGVIDVLCATDGKEYERFIVPAGACRMPRSSLTSAVTVDANGNGRSLDNIHMDGMGILSFVSANVPAQVKELLHRNDLEVSDVDLFVFHQASGMVLDTLTRLLHLDPSRVYRNLSCVGNTVSASIPLALKDALDDGGLHSGSRVVVSGFGVGLSWASALLEV
jgi:3-oxoacyl-[acyl-carrier-protein] synthase-3